MLLASSAAIPGYGDAALRGRWSRRSRVGGVRFRTLPQLRTPDVAARDRTCLEVGVSRSAGSWCGLAAVWLGSWGWPPACILGVVSMRRGSGGEVRAGRRGGCRAGAWRHTCRSLRPRMMPCSSLSLDSSGRASARAAQLGAAGSRGVLEQCDERSSGTTAAAAAARSAVRERVHQVRWRARRHESARALLLALSEGEIAK